MSEEIRYCPIATALRETVTIKAAVVGRVSEQDVTLTRAQLNQALIDINKPIEVEFKQGQKVRYRHGDKTQTYLVLSPTHHMLLTKQVSFNTAGRIGVVCLDNGTWYLPLKADLELVGSRS